MSHREVTHDIAMLIVSLSSIKVDLLIFIILNFLCQWQINTYRRNVFPKYAFGGKVSIGICIYNLQMVKKKKKKKVRHYSKSPSLSLRHKFLGSRGCVLYRLVIDLFQNKPSIFTTKMSSPTEVRHCNVL